jgi:hypothetical protein
LAGHASRQNGKKRRPARDTAAVVGWPRVPARVRDLLKAALAAAIGVRHVYTRDPTTQQWTRETDPDAIAAFLNRPNGGMRDGWTIYTTDPDVDLLRTLLAFQLGLALIEPVGDQYPMLLRGSR